MAISKMSSPRALVLIIKLAIRDMRAGLRGFGIFLACICLGVAAITGVGSVSQSLSDGLAREGRTILGGDVSFSLHQRDLTGDEARFLNERGDVAQVAIMRAMARNAHDLSALIELKAVEALYPRFGQVILDPPIGIGSALEEVSGVGGVVADSALLIRLNVKVGDVIAIGDKRLQLRAVLVSEPDKLAAGVGFGPRVMISKKSLLGTGLLQPGSLVRWVHRVTLKGARPGETPDDELVNQFAAEAQKAFPEAGWDIRTRSNVSPQFSKNLDRFTQFLTLVGLTALIVGGVGVANAVRGYAESKKPTIAILKSLGASGDFVFLVTLTQVVFVALLGISAGVILGSSFPYILSEGLKSTIPFPMEPRLHFGQIGLGFAYGLLTTLVFSIEPLGRTHDVTVSALLRDDPALPSQRARLHYLLMVGVAGLALCLLVVAFSAEKRLALIYMSATFGAYLLLRFMAAAIMWVARTIPRSKHLEWRMALTNIHRPGALTPSVVLSLGLGLALLVSLILIDGNIRNQLQQSLPGQTPSFFFLDVQRSQSEAFQEFLKANAIGAKIDRVPMMRGRILKVNGVSADAARVKESAAWVLEGDRGITFSDTLPDGSALVDGTWWARDSKGEPLVSLEAEIADGLGLKVGDSITINVLGRNLTAKIANTRTVNWRTLGINFVLVYSTNSFGGAPYTDLATVTFPKGTDPARELNLLREVAKAFPLVTSVRVKDALDAVNQVVGQLAVAVRGASGVALLASILVLAGALAAGQHTRIYEAVVLKTLGATRRRLLATLMLEYGLLGLATGIFGILAGGSAAYVIVTRVMKLEFVWLPSQAFLVALGGVVITIGLGLLGTRQVLGQKPASYLRDL